MARTFCRHNFQCSLHGLVVGHLHAQNVQKKKLTGIIRPQIKERGIGLVLVLINPEIATDRED
jgi:hypothetical protein